MQAPVATRSAPALLDASGIPIPAGSVRRMAANGAAHAAADRFSRELARWNPHLASADADLLIERNRIVARTRDIARNNGWASGALQRHVDQAIGAQFRLSARPDFRALGLGAVWARQWSRHVEAQFRVWANDPRFFCDAAERGPLSALLGLMFRQRLVEGEALGLVHWIPRTGFAFATAIQVVDPDRLSNPGGLPDTGSLRAGVEINRFGAPRAYHIRNTHPLDVLGFRSDRFRWTRVPRRTRWGRARVIHHFEQERAGQTRGKPLLTPILEKLKMLDHYEKTELQAAVVNAIFAAFIESPFDHEMLQDGLASNSLSEYQTQRKAFHDARQLALDGVRIPTLFPGEAFKFTTAARPNAAFPEFERAALRYVAAALGQSYEQLAQDWSQTNYSSARAALLEAWKFLTARRDHFVAGVAGPIYGLWLEEAIDNGTVEMPDGAPDFWAAPAAWARARFIGPGRGWVDPVKEATAARLRMEAGLSTLQDEAAEQGRDWEEVLEQRAHEAETIRSLGLTLPGWELDERDASEAVESEDR